MNRTLFWKLVTVLAVAGSNLICAQSRSTQPVAAASSPQIIPIGSPLTFGGTNVPDTYSDVTTFSSTPALVDSGKVKIWQKQVPTSADGEWDLFYMQVVDGSPLAGNINGDWNITMDYNLSKAPRSMLFSNSGP
jgi:hypothetical protein